MTTSTPPQQPINSAAAQTPPPAHAPHVTPEAKHWAYPFALRDTASPDCMISQFHALSAMNVGFFPIASSGFPNGSVHIGKECAGFITEEGFRSMADGEVIAYRLDNMHQILRYDRERSLRYSLGFVLVRHRLALPAPPVTPAATTAAQPGVVTATSAPAQVTMATTSGVDENLYIYSLYSYNKPLNRYPTDSDDFLTVSLPFWKGTRKYRVGTRANDTQTRPAHVSGDARSGAHGAQSGRARRAALPALATGLRVRAEGVGTAALIGLLPRDSILTVHGEATRGWAQIEAITRGSLLPHVVGGDVAPEAAVGGWVYLDELDSSPVPDPTNSIVILDKPYPVKAGECLGFMGDNASAADAGPDGHMQPMHPVVAIEVFAGDEFPAFLAESRRRAASLAASDKTILVIEQGAKLCSMLRAPDRRFAADKRVLPAAGDASRGLLVNGRLYSVKRQAKQIRPSSTERLGNYFKASGETPLSATAYDQLTTTGKAEYVEREVLAPDGTQTYWTVNNQPSGRPYFGWTRPPLVASEADAVVGFKATFTAIELSSLDESRFFSEADGTRWWNVQVGGSDNQPIYGWVCGTDHPGAAWESPHAWPGFEIADGSSFEPLSAMQRNVTITGTAYPEHEESFGPAVDVLGSSEMVRKLEEAIDYSGTLDGKVTAADIANARNTPWLARGLSRIIARFESQWSDDIARWEALTPYMHADWVVEMRRQNLRGWWNDVAPKVAGFPAHPSVHHVHPFGWVANFAEPPRHPEITIDGVKVVIPFLGMATGARITDGDYEKAASDLGCEENVIRAVALSETKSTGPFYLPGRVHAAGDDSVPSILYERHIFHRLTHGAYDQVAPTISNSHGYGDLQPYGLPSKQYPKLLLAYGLDKDAALKAASWGTFQIMGMNHLACGYATVADYVLAMGESEVQHLKAFVSYALADNRLIRALRHKDWLSFARIFNGPGQTLYDVHMRENYESLTGGGA